MSEPPTPESNAQTPVLKREERAEDEGQVTRDVGQRDAEIAAAKPVKSPHPPNSSTPRTAPPILWRIAQTFLHTLHALFGDPPRIAFQHTLTKEAYDLLLCWIRCGEALMRRLLLIEAAAYPKPNTRPLLHPKRTRARKLVGFDDDKPETWRVSFRCLIGDTHALRRTRQARKPESRACVSPIKPDDFPEPIGDMTFHQGPWFTAKPPKFYAAWPLAERYEALLRVFNNPAPYARRLAKRLHAALHRLPEILRAPPEAEHRIERFEALTHSAETPWRIPNTS